MRLVLYEPEIAQNAGAAIRIAACFAAGIDIIEPCGFPADAKGLRRAAMDYGALAPPVLHASFRAFLDSAERAEGRLILLSTKGTTSLFDFAFDPLDLVLIGRESGGVPDEVRAACEAFLRVPIAPGARSLNAAATGAIALAEMRRQVGWAMGPSPEKPS
jgi:tRNA (cytidine/uridine-2'-O-)-methyltransferase